MKTKYLALICGTLAFAAGARAVEICLAGASTTVNAVINPHKAAVEAATGFTLKVVGTNTGRGLVALMEGQADVALTSEPLDVSMIAAKFMGKQLDAADFQLHSVTTAELVWIVHPSNPVGKLTRAQIKDIHTGKITNWKDVGGLDLPIAVFTDPVGAGTRTFVQFVVLDREEFGPRVRALESIRFIASSVAESRGGFGGIGLSFVDVKTMKVLEADHLSRPLGFITKGAPTTDVQTMIDAFRAQIAPSKVK